MIIELFTMQLFLYTKNVIFWLKFSSGRLGNILPPPRHNGEDAIPARARPVPFCLNGLRVDFATSLLSFCARVPLRALAKNAVAVSLGNSRLRTETAGVVACIQMNLLHE